MKDNEEASREIPYHLGETRNPSQRQAGGGRKEMIELLEKHSKGIIQSAGSVFVSAQQVLHCMHDLGHFERVSKANGVGDVLGEKGFKLPYAYASRKSGRRYLIPAMEWSPAQREEFFTLSDDDKVKQVRALEKELLGIDYDAFVQSIADVNAKADDSDNADLDDPQNSGASPAGTEDDEVSEE